MEKSSQLQAALEARFFPHVESLGFIRDKRHEPRIMCFRRRTDSAMQIFEVLWERHGRPQFMIQFAEAPIGGIDDRGKHVSAEDVLPGHFALLRGWLIPERGNRWFRLSSPWRRLISRQPDDAGALVQRLLQLLPEIIAWWKNKAKGAHLIILSPLPPPAMPSHAPVFGCSVKPSLLQKFFARDGLWTIGFFGIAVVVDLALALQAPDLKQMVGMVVVGAAVGVVVAWLVFKILWRIRVWINGGPFHKGDLVQVIAGAHGGKIASVYEEWPSRKQVRVDLGELECAEVKDVFSDVQLLRVKSPSPATESPAFEAHRAG